MIVSVLTAVGMAIIFLIESLPGGPTGDGAFEVSNWKPVPGNGSPSRVRIQESNENHFDRMPFNLLPLNVTSHVIPSVLSNGVGNYLYQPTIAIEVHFYESLLL